MTLTELAADLAARVRADGANSPAVVVGLHLTFAVWAAVDPADIDTELHWGTAAMRVRTLLDTLDPQPAQHIDIPPGLLNDTDTGIAATAVAELLTVIADAFAAAADRPWPYTTGWYRDSEQELRDAAAALS